MDTILFLEILFGMALFYAAIGIFASYQVKNVKDFFLADRGLGVFKLTFTLIATQLGSGMLLGTTERAYQYGIYGILYVLGISVGFLILGMGLAGKLRSLNISTTAEIFETRYNSRNLKLVASALSIISLWGLLLAQILASKHIFTGLDVTNPYIFVGFWLFLIFYTMLGGLTSIAIIDSIQVLFILVVFFYIVYSSLPTTLPVLLSQETTKTVNYYYFSDLPKITELLPAFLTPVLFSLIEQDLAQRFFAAKNKWVASFSALLASIFIIAFACIPIFFGIFARIGKISFGANSSPLMPLLKMICSPTVLILAICGVIAAITSTADSLLCAASSNISQDFLPLFPKIKKKLTVSRMISFITGISALVVSFFITNDIISVIVGSYRITVSCLFVPIFIAYFKPKGNKWSALAAILCGGITYLLVTLLMEYSVLHDIIPLLASLGGYILVEVISKKPTVKKVNG